jgi:CubicO group peptidase (beta-lactamase class C family)
MLRSSLLAFVLGWVGTPLFAAEPPFDDAWLARIPQRMREFIGKGQIAGAVTLVATPDRVVHLEAVGQADIAAQRPMQRDTLFRIASMTKLVTATALMQQVEAGKLSPDDPVEKHIPAFVGQKLKDGTTSRPVTIRDVMTHTAGLANPRGDEVQGMTLEQVVALIGRKPVEFEPGSKWQYSSGLTVAGRLVEVASGMSFADYVQEQIFKPLGLQDTAFRLTHEQTKRLAATYKPGKEPNTLEVVEIPDPTAARTPNPSGGLYSTASDMARFYQAILQGGTLDGARLLSKTSTTEMLRPQTPGITTGFTPGNAWAFGWCVVQQPQGVTRLLPPGTYGHGGAWGTQGWIDPQRGLIFVLMIQRSGFGNSDGSDVRDAFTELAVKAYRGSETPHAKFVERHGYRHAIELQQGTARAVLCPEAGGRVLEFSLAGKDAMYLDPQEAQRPLGKAPPMTAGRFDFGPELTTPGHPQIWGGEWTAEITGESSARLTSLRDEASGVQLIRDFELRSAADGSSAPSLVCKQTIVNVSTEVREYCHWGRSFSPGGGICLVPLSGRSKFPSRYAMYEDSAIINVRATDDRIRERDGVLEILAPPRKPKLGFDSQAGWLAYSIPNDLLFVKKFATHPDRVYNEAAGLTLSVWYPEGPRIELEPIGPRERLQPGEAASFTEEWWLLPHPFPKAGESLDIKAVKERVARLGAKE